MLVALRRRKAPTVHQHQHKADAAASSIDLPLGIHQRHALPGPSSGSDAAPRLEPARDLSPYRVQQARALSDRVARQHGFQVRADHQGCLQEGRKGKHNQAQEAPAQAQQARQLERRQRRRRRRQEDRRLPVLVGRLARPRRQPARRHGPRDVCHGTPPRGLSRPAAVQALQEKRPQDGSKGPHRTLSQAEEGKGAAQEGGARGSGEGQGGRQRRGGAQGRRGQRRDKGRRRQRRRQGKGRHRGQEGGGQEARRRQERQEAQGRRRARQGPQGQEEKGRAQGQGSQAKRTRRRRATVRRHTGQWPAVRPVSDVQEPFHGSQACRRRPIAPLRHAPGGLPKEEPGQAAESRTGRQRARRGRRRSQQRARRLGRGDGRRHGRAGALEPSAAGPAAHLHVHQAPVSARQVTRAAADGHQRRPHQHLPGGGLRRAEASGRGRGLAGRGGSVGRAGPGRRGPARVGEVLELRHGGRAAAKVVGDESWMRRSGLGDFLWAILASVCRGFDREALGTI